MRIKISEISDNKIVFNTPLGIGKGIWMSDPLPRLDESYDVEIEINDSLKWGENVSFTEADKEAIGIDNEYVYIQGKIEGVDSDGLVILRLGDSVIMLDSFTTLPPAGSFIRIEAVTLQLFNVNT
ncbi:MAG: hypothetical protein M3384_20125 [Acidobacteriota bacterium]|nr:hypothetical protein [Acidobacteriota bacterium]